MRRYSDRAWTAGILVWTILGLLYLFVVFREEQPEFPSGLVGPLVAMGYQQKGWWGIAAVLIIIVILIPVLIALVGFIAMLAVDFFERIPKTLVAIRYRLQKRKTFTGF